LPLTAASIREIHRRFCALLPDDLLWIEDDATKARVKMIPGELRRRDVMVGSHVAISPGAVPRFLDRFEETYSRLGRAETILAAAARITVSCGYIPSSTATAASPV